MRCGNTGGKWKRNTARSRGYRDYFNLEGRQGGEDSRDRETFRSNRETVDELDLGGLTTTIADYLGTNLEMGGNERDVTRREQGREHRRPIRVSRFCNLSGQSVDGRLVAWTGKLSRPSRNVSASFRRFLASLRYSPTSIHDAHTLVHRPCSRTSLAFRSSCDIDA